MLSRKLLLTVATLGMAASAHAQWVTQSFDVRPGWTAIFPLVDASDVTLDQLIPPTSDIEELWRWDPEPLDPTILSTPGTPVQGNEWRIWKNGFPVESTIDRLLPNFGYLVKTKSSASPFTLEVKGRAALPDVTWRIDGLNLVGFPAETSPRPTVSLYLAPSGLIGQTTSIFRYLGGPIESNPAQLTPNTSGQLKRGEALWINTGDYSDYAGPVQVDVAFAPGLDFGTKQTLHKLVLTNRANEPVTVTLTPEPSESPRGSGTVPPQVPLLERVIDPLTANQSFEDFSAPITVDIPAKTTVSKTFAADRAAMAASPVGTTFESLLTVTENLGAGGNSLSRIHVPVSATVSDRAGLWVGEAMISAVQNQLQKFQRDADGNYVYQEVEEPYVDPADGQTKTRTVERRIPIGGSTDTGLNPVPSPFPIRLIVHFDGTTARLLSTIYAGPVRSFGQGPGPGPGGGGSTFGLTTDPHNIDEERRSDAARITAVHYPLDMNLPLSQPLAPGATLAATLTLNHDDPTNPFVHTYHPDHDNLDARFENQLPATPLAAGPDPLQTNPPHPRQESFNVRRSISLEVESAGPSANPNWGTSLLSGTYSETIAGLHKSDIEVSGQFTLRRLSDIRTLTQQ